MTLTTRTNVEPIDPSLVPFFVSEIVRDEYFQVATLSVLLYDTFITLDKEAKFFWKIPRKPVDFVYFVNRYVGIFGAAALLVWNSFSATLPLCNFSEWTIEIANWIIIISIDYILMIRVLALYSQDKALALFLKTTLLLEAMSKLGLIIYLVLLEHISLDGFAAVTLCSTNNLIPWQLGMIDWLIPLVYGTILMIFALYKAAEYWRMSSGFKGFMLVKVLMQDQLMYYALVILCSMFAIMEFKLEMSNAFLASVMNALGKPSFLCVLGSRMLFNLKEAGERGQNEGTSYRTPSRPMSEMEFAERVIPQRESEISTEVDGREGSP